MPRNQPEYRLHCLVADLLRLLATPGVFAFHPANGEYRSPRTGARLKRMGVVRGVPDFVILAPGKPAIGLELKPEGGRQSPEQRAVEQAWNAAGGKYVVARGYADAYEFLTSEGLIRAVPTRSRFAPRQREAA